MEYLGKGHRFDLVIIDVRMSFHKTIPLFRALKAQGIPILACADPDFESRRRELVKAGVTEIISDAVEFWEFQLRCLTLLKLGRQQRQLETFRRWSHQAVTR